MITLDRIIRRRLSYLIGLSTFDQAKLTEVFSGNKNASGDLKLNSQPNIMLPPSLQFDLPDLSNCFLGDRLKRDWFCLVGETYPSFFFVNIFCFRSPERKRKFTNKQTR